MDTVKINSRVPSEDEGLVRAGDVDLVNDPGVEVRLEVEFVAVRFQVPRQPQFGPGSRGKLGGGGVGRTGCWIHGLNLDVVHDQHGEDAGDGRDGQYDRGDGKNLGYVESFRHDDQFAVW